MLSPGDLILVDLAEKPEAHCPQPVQVFIVVPFSGGADLHAGAKVLVGPSQFAVVCTGPVTRASGTQKFRAPHSSTPHVCTEGLSYA